MIGLENDKKINAETFSIIFYLKFAKVLEQIISISKNNIHIRIYSLQATVS